MVLNDYKRKSIKLFIKKFNAETHDNSGIIVINNVYSYHINSLRLDGDQVIIRRIIGDTMFITGIISIDSIISMYYPDENHNIISIDNLEF